jgi:hypothetical protein
LPGQLATDAREEFAAGVRAVVQPYADRGPDGLVEDVPIDVLIFNGLDRPREHDVNGRPRTVFSPAGRSPAGETPDYSRVCVGS